MKTSEMRQKFPEFSDEDFRIYKQEIDTMVFEGKITMDERNRVLEQSESICKILDEKGL